MKLPAARVHFKMEDSMNAKMDSNPYIGNAAEKDPATFFVAIANVERDQDQDQERCRT